MSSETSSRTPQHGFRPDIEGLRGIAILLVIAYHVGLPGITGGYVGVDVFFVLSGYLITGLLVREALSTGHIDFIQFYARRGRRLLPAAIVMLLITLVAGWVILSPTEIHDLAVSVTSAFTYISNGLFAYKATNYLADDARGNPVLHTWSLAVEEQFYFFWPLLVALALRASKKAFPASEQQRLTRLTNIVLIASALSLVLCIALTRFAEAWAFFGSPARVWEFGVGALAVLIEKSVITTRRHWVPYLSIGGVIALVISAVVYTTETRFPGIAAALPVFGTAAILMTGTSPTPTPVTRLLDTSVLQFTGRVSYSWYLWHWPVLTFAWLLRPEMQLPGRLLCMGLALLLAVTSYYLVESPIRYSVKFRTRPSASVLTALGATFASAVIAQGVRIAATHAGMQPSQIAYSRAHSDLTRLTKMGCTLSYWGVTPGKGCAFGDLSSDTTVVLFGDSHADHWFPAVEQIGTERHWKILPFSKSECPSVSVPLSSRKLGRTYNECAAWRTAVIQQIIADKPLLVIMSNSSAYVPHPGESPESWEVPAHAWETGMRTTTTTLGRAGIRTLVLEDVFRPNFNVPQCLARHAWSSLWQSDECTFTRSRGLNIAVADAEARGVAGVPYATVANVNPDLCHTDVCQTVRGDSVMYRDSHHLTASFSRSLAPWLLNQINIALTNSPTVSVGQKVRNSPLKSSTL